MESKPVSFHKPLQRLESKEIRIREGFMKCKCAFRTQNTIKRLQALSLIRYLAKDTAQQSHIEVTVWEGQFLICIAHSVANIVKAMSLKFAFRFRDHFRLQVK